MVTELQLGDINIEVVYKEIKNIHLGVYPPDGKVRIAATARSNPETVRVFAISKLAWIKQQRQKFQNQPRETPREYLDRESHYLWGKRYLLKVAYSEDATGIFLRHNKILLRVKPGTDQDGKAAIMEEWQRQLLKEAVEPLLEKWQPILGVAVARLYVQRMKTRWGSCNPAAKSIRLNTELVKKPPEYLEYIIVHEMVHLLEPTHNQRFQEAMERFMPGWRHYRDALNQLPIGFI